MATQEILAGNVQRGIELLHSRGPMGWSWMIDINRLHIESSVDCPLGQVYGNFSEGLLALPEIDGRTYQFGFTGQEHLPIWKAEIRKLQTMPERELATA